MGGQRNPIPPFESSGYFAVVTPAAAPVRATFLSMGTSCTSHFETLLNCFYQLPDRSVIMGPVKLRHTLLFYF